NLHLDVLARANFATRRFSDSLGRGSEPFVVHGPFWFNAACTNVTNMDGLKKGFERIVWNAQGAASFDGAEAAVIDPIVDDLAGHVELRSNFVGSKVIGSHDLSSLLN